MNDRDGAARGEFARLLLEGASVQAVADAEEAVCVAWTHHLNSLVDRAEAEVDTARRASRAARDLVRLAQTCGDSVAVRTAQDVLETAEVKEHRVMAEARQVLGAVQDEVQAVAAAEHAREEAIRQSALKVAALRGGRYRLQD